MRVLAAAHDAGGANQLLYKFRGRKNVTFILTGPASEIANSLGIEHSSQLELESVLNYDIIFVGSNSHHQLSDDILNFATSHNLATVGILEHWVNYPSRWKIPPRRVEVQDVRALIGGILAYGWKIRISRNHYLNYLKSKVEYVDGAARSLLVILQPIQNTFSHEIPDSCFCLAIEKLVNNHPSITSITIREHALTPTGDCFRYLETSLGLRIKVSNLIHPLEQDLASSSTVLGLDSYALFLAKKLGRNVFSISKKRRSWFAPKYEVVP